MVTAPSLSAAIAVLDLTEEFYLQTIDIVFQRHLLALHQDRGTGVRDQLDLAARCGAGGAALRCACKSAVEAAPTSVQSQSRGSVNSRVTAMGEGR